MRALEFQCPLKFRCQTRDYILTYITMSTKSSVAYLLYTHSDRMSIIKVQILCQLHFGSEHYQSHFADYFA